MVEEEEGHDNEDRGRKGISNYKSVTLLGLQCFPQCPLDLLHTLHMWRKKLGSLHV